MVVQHEGKTKEVKHKVEKSHHDSIDVKKMVAELYRGAPTREKTHHVEEAHHVEKHHAPQH